VETAIEKYPMYLLTVPETKIPKVTTTYSLVPPSLTNVFYFSTEEAVIRSVDYERERDSYLKRVQQVVTRLSYKERQITIERYISFEKNSIMKYTMNLE
jgi:ArpU family phage transcriptional regulator